MANLIRRKVKDRDNQSETCLIITINDTSIGDLPLIINISDTCKNQPKRLDSDNTGRSENVRLSTPDVPDVPVMCAKSLISLGVPSAVPQIISGGFALVALGGSTAYM